MSQAKPHKYFYFKQATIIKDIIKTAKNQYQYITEDGSWCSRFLMDVPMNKPCVVTVSVNKDTHEQYFTSAKLF